VARSGKADALVTGNIRHYSKIEKPDLNDLLILSPAQFLEWLTKFRENG